MLRVCVGSLTVCLNLLGCGPEVSFGPTEPEDADGAESSGGVDSTDGLSASEAGSGSGDDAGPGPGDEGDGDGETADGGTDTGGKQAPACLDGALDPGEDCDDGNDIDGDGCNRDCTLSGQLLWEYEFPERMVTKVGFDADSEVTAGLHRYNFSEVAVARYAPDGEQLWQVEVAGVSLGDLSVAPSGEVTAYTQSTGALISLLHPDGDLLWTAQHPGYWGNAVVATDAAVVASFGPGYLASYGADSTPQWTAEQEVLWLLPAPSGGVYARSDNGAMLLDVNGEVVWTHDLPCAGPAAINPVDGRLWIAGLHSAPEVTICTIGEDESTQQRTFGAPAQDGYVQGLGIGGDESIVVATRIGTSTSFSVDKHHDQLGLLHAREVAHWQSLAVDRTTNRIAIGSTKLSVISP